MHLKSVGGGSEDRQRPEIWGSKITWQMEGTDLIFRDTQATEFGRSRGIELCEGSDGGLS